ncbi:YopX family protein [Caloramator sp. CAR-1]|uniref:YopX family protein n=1 Tax=Caloramator sp. CAR-1 TaxID=3062777 RepID=UPI0026E1A883|nr:YopX family protein [Caloramator sp. CAR-1]MDO6353984.1 YopX family protein [Caloramator sp. CAR-1]
MREIKFRAWNRAFDEMYYFDFAHNIEVVNGDLWVRHSNGRTCIANNPRIVLMQYTGLKDDNGTEIYEGDIVEIHDTSETKNPYISQVYITYDGVLVDPHPVHKILGHDYSRRLSWFCDYGVGYEYFVKCKVIGNIYENPELLEEINHE